MNSYENILAKVKQWWSTIPLFTRLIIYITIPLSIFAIFADLAKFLIIVPYNFLQGFSFWQLFTFPLQHISPLANVFTLLAYVPTACVTEKTFGTYRYISFFIIANALAGGLFVMILYFAALTNINFFVVAYYSYPCAGLWPIIMTEMVIRYNKQPEEIGQFWCFPIKLKNKYHPWVLFLLFSLVFMIVFDVLAGIAIGYLCK